MNIRISIFFALTIAVVILLNGCIQQIEPKIMHKGLHYDAMLDNIDINISEAIEQAKIEGYAIRILKSPARCKNPIPDKGCKGEDYIPPVYEYINAQDDSVWNNLPKLLAINEENRVRIEFSTNDFAVYVGAQPFDDKEKWFIKVVPASEIETQQVKQYINDEFIKLGILSKGATISTIFGEGYSPPHLISKPYTCPQIKTIDCMPVVPPGFGKYCSGPYHEWIKENCEVQFTY